MACWGTCGTRIRHATMQKHHPNRKRIIPQLATRIMVPDSDVSKSHVYLDTSVLVGLIPGKMRDRSHYKSVLSRLDAHTIDVIVPQVVLGEAVAVVMRDIPDSELQQSLWTVLNDVQCVVDQKHGIPPVTMDIVTLATDLSMKLGLSSFTDALVLAHALNATLSTRLITDDAELHSSKVGELERQMRSDGKRERTLSVTDGTRKG